MINPNVPQNNEANKAKAIQKAMSPSKQDHVHLTKNPQTAKERIDKKMNSYKDAKGAKEMASPASKQKQRANQHMDAVNPKSPILSAPSIPGSIAKGIAEGAAQSLVPSQAQRLAKQAYGLIPKEQKEAISEGAKAAVDEMKDIAKDFSDIAARKRYATKRKKDIKSALNTQDKHFFDSNPTIKEDEMQKNVSDVSKKLDPRDKFWKQMPDRMKAFQLMGIDEYLPIRYKAKVEYPREDK